MFKIFKQTVQKFINKPEYTTPLGRWGRNVKNISDFNSSMANHDHCGDELCKIDILMKSPIHKMKKPKV